MADWNPLRRRASWPLLLVFALAGCGGDASNGGAAPAPDDGSGTGLRGLDHGSNGSDTPAANDGSGTPTDGSTGDPSNGGSGSDLPSGTCGNGIREAGEECDGTDLPVDYCAAFGWTGNGFLTCNSHCLLEAPGCDTGLCGNGVVDPGEDCDGGASRTSAACSLDCHLPSGGETEPNDTTGSANLLTVQPGSEGHIAGRLTPDDVDTFRIQVDGPYELLAYTSDGRGSCAVDTVLRLLGSAGDELAYSDDDGIAPCSQIDTALAGAGTYYLEVSGFFGDSGDYTLGVLLTQPVCGDGRVSAGEECDDHNTADNDGCDHACRFEAVEEVEPNDTPGGAGDPFTVTSDSPLLLRGALSGANDVDLFPVAMGLGDSFTRIDLLAGGAVCQLDADLALLAPDGETVLASTYSYTGEDSYCASLTEDYDSGIANLEAGVYYIEVSSSYGASGSYLLNVITRQASCGNGIRERGELCDDANDDPNDGCDACTLTGPTETETNDTPGQANDLGTFTEPASTTVAGEITGNDVDFFSFTVDDYAKVSAYTDDGASDCPFDTYLELFDADGTSLAADDDGGVSSCSRLDATDPGMSDLAAGTYTFEVRPYSSYSSGGVYVLHLSIDYPVCGDGVVEGAEVCDDHNTDDLDGCDHTCFPEGTPETESNDDLAEADGPYDLTSGGEVRLVGELSSATDIDYFEVTVGAGTKLVALLWNGGGGCAVDGRVSLRTTDNAVIRDGVSLSANQGCWQVGGTADPYGASDPLDAGTYVVRVVSPTSDVGGYQLVLRTE